MRNKPLKLRWKIVNTMMDKTFYIIQKKFLWWWVDMSFPVGYIYLSSEHDLSFAKIRFRNKRKKVLTEKCDQKMLNWIAYGGEVIIKCTTGELFYGYVDEIEGLTKTYRVAKHLHPMMKYLDPASLPVECVSYDDVQTPQ